MTADRPATEPRTDPTTMYDRGFEHGATPERHAHVDGCGHSGEGVEPEFMRGWRAGRDHRKQAEAAQGAAPLPIGQTTNGDIPNEQQRILPAVQGAAPRAEGRCEYVCWMERGHDGPHLMTGDNPMGVTLDMSCDRIVNNGMGEPTECGRSYPCDLHDEGAAPRAEGLDVENVARVLHELGFVYWAGADDHPPFGECYCSDARREDARDFLARLSRPSDERVPESEEPR